MVNNRIDALEDLRKQLEGADVDLLREMVKVFAERLMGADADAVCGADYGERSPDRTNHRNGYRERPWDTRAGTIALRVPKLREGTYFPDWLLEPRRRAERAFVQVVAECYVRGVSTRRVEGLVAHLGIERISKSRVSEMAKELDSQVEAFRTRPLEGGPYTYVWMDVLTQKVREGGRIVNIACVVATGVNTAGNREILGTELFTTEDGAGWTAFLRGLVARGLCGGGLGPVPPRARPAPRALPRCSRAARGRRGRHLGVHGVPLRSLEADLVQQPAGATEQGDPPPHRRRGHLPEPVIGDPPRRHGLGRAARRVAGRPSLHERRVAHERESRGDRGRVDRGGGEKRAGRGELMIRMTLWTYTT